jgi:hypothetical protein
MRAICLHGKDVWFDRHPDRLPCTNKTSLCEYLINEKIADIVKNAQMLAGNYLPA